MSSLSIFPSQVIELCAVLSRRQFFSNFEEIAQNTSPETQNQLKNQIIHLIRTSDEHGLRKKMCGCAAELTKRFIGEMKNSRGVKAAMSDLILVLIHR